MPRKKIQINRESTNKDSFFSLLVRESLPKEPEKGDKGRSGGYSGKRV